MRRTRGLHRGARKRGQLPTVALVGYTNAGKSTLFNRVTGAGVMAKDLLFATLDPTMRAIALPTGRDCVLSDTVGFISDLPTHLVAAFRATLEEVAEADLILHVRDVAHPDSDRQRDDVETVLQALGRDRRGQGEGSGDAPMIEALNKIDALPEETRHTPADPLVDRRRTALASSRSPPLSGEGVDQLLQAVGDIVGEAEPAREIEVPLSDGATLAWIYRHGDVRARHDDGEVARLTVALDAASTAQLERRLGR